jgi:sugar transferase (PEP-CTERM system associated)
MKKLFGHYIPRGLLFSYITEIIIVFSAIFIAIPVALSVFTHETLVMGDLSLYPYAILYTVVMHLAMISTGLYQRDLPSERTTLILRMLVSIAISGIAIYMVNLWLRLDVFCLHTLTIAGFFTFSGIISSRLLLFREAETSTGHHRVLVIGTGEKASSLQHRLVKPKLKTGLLSRTGINMVGYVDVPGSNTDAHILKSQIIRLDSKSLSQYAKEKNINEIIIALDERRNKLPIDDLIECRLNGVRITDIATFLERDSGSIILENFQPNSLIFSEGVVQAIRLKTKRIVDVLASLMILMLTLPVMLVTAVVIWLESGRKGSILYCQERVGLNGKCFKLLKFRSMIENAEKDGQAVWAQQNDMRVTRFGRFIRKTRIDELPQLLNVLKGEMSMVGPRPERPQFVNELAREIPYYNLRHYVLPGITGWAQICYPYGASVEDARQKLQFDLYYIKNYSVLLDVLILLQTTAVILWGKGAR